ncbi:MAG: wax ester/triacylglycerol synthase family O-acyltransferase [Sporichthyaceae bacterium]
MADRLSPLDASFLYVEEPTTPMHVGTVAVFEEPKDGFDYDRLVDLISERIAFVPRYRQRVRDVPGHLANPVWVDDENFDIGYHARRSALPRPGNDEQLFELVARVQGRVLDRNRPLWEMYIVEGLSEKRFAIITKTHHAMVDGIDALDIGQVILDTSPAPARPKSRKRAVLDAWRPEPEPSWVELIAGAVTDTVRRPTAAVDTLRGGLSEVRSTAGRLVGAAGGLFAIGLTAARPAPGTPLNVVISGQRRFASVATDLDDYRRIRKAHGGTVNDVVLAAIAGALRAWLLTRAESVSTATIVRAMVPVSVQDDGENGPVVNRVSSYLVDLPVGEPSPVMRLHQVSYRMKAHKETGQAVGAESLVGLAGFAPPTLHALGARAASSMSKRWFNLVVTNVPGPQQPLYVGGSRMLASYPVVPLAKTQALSIGLTSYDGQVFYGLNADRDAMPDIDVLAQCIVDAVAELLESVR